nr:hypothetical protein [uncultured Flavobacterium sp.]
MNEEIKINILSFLQRIDTYYGCKTEVTSGIYTITDSFAATNTTWNLSEFNLVRSAFRREGERIMMEGEKMYYEISASNIIDFKQPSRHSFEIIEAYGGTTFRITKIKFHSKY